MNQVLLVFITAIVTGIASVTTLWFGSSLTRGNEDVKWRRDHVLEAYTDFARTIDLIRAESDRIYIAIECTTPEHVKQAEVIFEKLLEMDRISYRIYLLAPDVVRAKMNALTDHLSKEVAHQSIKCPKMDKDERSASMTQTAELQVAFMNAARNDLGVNRPLYTIEEWSAIWASEKPWWKFGR